MNWILSKFHPQHYNTFTNAAQAFQHIMEHHLNCKLQESQSSNGITQLIFKYQARYVSIIFHDATPHNVNISYMTPFTVPADKADIISEQCNVLNSSIYRRGVTAAYHVSDDFKEYNLLLSADLSLFNDSPESVKMVSDTFDHFFAAEHSISLEVNQNIANDNQLARSRERRINRQLTINGAIEAAVAHNTKDEALRFSPDKALTFPVIVQEFHDMQVFKPMAIDALTADKRALHIADAEQCLNFNVLETVIGNDQNFLAFESAMLKFSYLNSEELLCEETITITPLHKQNSSLYAKITALHSTENSPQQANSIHPVEVTAAYDFNGTENEAEFKFMLSDAHDKMRDGKHNELSEAQRAIIATNDNVRLQRELYYGTKLFHAQLHYQALPYLLRAFQIIKNQVCNDNAPQEKVNTYYDIAYMIGTTYNELQRFDAAYYYLDIVVGNLDIAANIQFAECMVNSHDPRSLNWLKDEFEEFSQRGEDQIPTYYLEFLVQRIILLMLSEKQFHAAQNYLKRTASQYLSEEFINQELDFVKQEKDKNMLNQDKQH